MAELDRCPAAPAGESHRWRIPNQGTAGPARCKWCQAERTFAPFDDTSIWDTAGERQAAHTTGITLRRSTPSRVW